MKKTITFLLSIICCSLLSNAQEASKNVISITTDFVKGDTLKYTIEEGKKKYKNDNMIDSVIAEKKMNLIVIDSTEKGYLIQIDMIQDKKTDDLVADFMENESNASFLYSFKNLKIQYRISPVGVFQGFENIDAISKIMEKSADYYYAKAKIEPKKIEKLKKTFLAPKFLESHLGKYVTLIHSFHGYEYEADTIKIFDNQITNLFSSKGGTIPAKTEFLIEYTDSTEVFANIQQVTTADAAAMKLILADAGNVFSYDKKTKKAIKNTELTLYQRLNCEYHIPSGIPTYIFSKKETEATDKDNNEVSLNLEYIEIKLD